MVSLKKKSESLIKYYIKVTCALKWARKLPRKTETYESAKCVPCNTRKCTHNGFVSDLLKWALKCRFYATGPWYPANWASKLAGCFLVLQVTVQRLSQSCVYYVRQWSHPGWAGGGGYWKNVYFLRKEVPLSHTLFMTLYPFQLWCGYCSVSFQSCVLRQLVIATVWDFELNP